MSLQPCDRRLGMKRKKGVANTGRGHGCRRSTPSAFFNDNNNFEHYQLCTNFPCIRDCWSAPCQAPRELATCSLATASRDYITTPPSLNWKLLSIIRHQSFLINPSFSLSDSETLPSTFLHATSHGAQPTMPLKISTCCASPCVGAEAACTFTFIVPNIYSPSHVPYPLIRSRFSRAKRDLGRDRRVLRPADERACRKIEQGRANAWFWSIELVQALGDGAGEVVVDAQRPRQRPPHFAQLVHALYATAL